MQCPYKKPPNQEDLPEYRPFKGEGNTEVEVLLC